MLSMGSALHFKSRSLGSIASFLLIEAGCHHKEACIGEFQEPSFAQGSSREMFTLGIRDFFLQLLIETLGYIISYLWTTVWWSVKN